ncbi:MAG: hypothetical protein ACI8RD_003547, partial [Bacillariaceae sp.]|jgi:hypothetical protein
VSHSVNIISNCSPVTADGEEEKEKEEKPRNIVKILELLLSLSFLQVLSFIYLFFNLPMVANLTPAVSSSAADIDSILPLTYGDVLVTANAFDDTTSKLILARK